MKKRFMIKTVASVVISAMIFGATGAYATTDNENGVKDMIDALSKTVQQIQTDLGLVKQQAVDAYTEAQNAQTTAQDAVTQAQNANTIATNANNIAQQEQQQVAALQQEVYTLKSTVEAQKQEINSLQNQVHSTMNLYKLHFINGHSGITVAGLSVTIEGLGTFTTDSNGDFLVYVPVKYNYFNMTIDGGYKFQATQTNTTVFQTSENHFRSVINYPVQVVK